MGHCIQAIVASIRTADAICRRHPQLAQVPMSEAYAILPVDAAFADSVAGPRLPQFSSDFMLLTDGFRDFLSELSRLGPLAYVETEYFGGAGGQGAAIYDGGKEVMQPAWREAGVINEALALLGVEATKQADAFDRVGLDAFRSNDELRDAALRTLGANVASQIRVKLYGDDAHTAFIALPGYPEEATPGIVKKTIRLTDLIADYQGPGVGLEFDEQGVLIGIEILV